MLPVVENKESLADCFTLYCLRCAPEYSLYCSTLLPIISVPVPLLTCLCPRLYIFSKLLLFAISMCVVLLSCTCACFHVGSYSLSFLTHNDAGEACKRRRGQGDNISRLQTLVNTQDSNSWKLRTTWNLSSESSISSQSPTSCPFY